MTDDVTLMGIVDDLSIDDYHSGPGISKTGLDRINRSPAHYYAMTLDPHRPPEKSRVGQLEGNLAHCAILEPQEFDKRYVVLPEDAPDRPTEAMLKAKNPSENSIKRQEWWASFEEEIKDRQVITLDQYETAMRQSESVWAIPDVAELLSEGVAESSAYWIDPDTGVLCRCRPDWVHPVNDRSVILLDVKTYSDASPDEFARQVARKRYEVQDAFYSSGYEVASGKEVLAFIFVSVESDWPHAASASILDERSRESGRAKYRRDLDVYAQCLKSGEWPGHGDSIHQISLPEWAL